MKRPTYTLTSLIKTVFRSGERSLPRKELCERLQERLAHTQIGQSDGEAVLAEVLRAPHSPVRTGHTAAIIELTYQPHQLYDLAYRFLRDTHVPRTTEQIVPELRRQTQFSWNQVNRLLQLERDPRFVQYQGDRRWFLAEWEVANDLVYAYAREHGLEKIAIRSLPFFLESEIGLSARGYVFLPELDARFEMAGESMLIRPVPEMDRAQQNGPSDAPQEDTEAVQAEEAHPVAQADANHDAAEAVPADSVKAAPDVAESAIAEAEGSAEAGESVEAEEAVPANEANMTARASEPETQAEVAATAVLTADHHQLSFEEEPFVNTIPSQPVLQEVYQMLQQSLARLQARQQQMAQEVVAFFQQNDMSAIEALMKEKHKNEQLALAIQQALAVAEQQ